MKIRCDSNGLHLFGRDSGLNILFDEFDVPVERWSTVPRFVSVALTNACDLHCEFCYAPKVAARLSSDLVVKWAIELDMNGCLGLGFGGGEPTLYPGFSNLCETVTSQTDLAVTFTTHGHRINDAMAERLHGSVHFVRVSIDGIGETYERIRGRPFDDIVARIRLIREIAPFGINYVINRSTILDLDLAAQLASELGAVEMLLLPERPVGGVGGIDESSLEMLEDWIRADRCIRLAVSDSTQLTGIPIAHPFQDTDPLTAYAHIDASGRIRRSSFASDSVYINTSIVQSLTDLRRTIEVPS